MNFANMSIAAGVSLTTYAAYKYATANQKPEEEAAHQKRNALLFLAAGTATIALGAGLNNSGTDETARCPIKNLNQILDTCTGGRSSFMAQTFEVLNETQGISCDNYLPWQNKFYRGSTGHIDGIRANDLAKPAMWGIDDMHHPFIAIKYVCDQTNEGAVALFQRYIGIGKSVAAGGHFQPDGCELGPLNPVTNYVDDFLGKLAILFKGGHVVSTTVLKNPCILTLAK